MRELISKRMREYLDRKRKKLAVASDTLDQLEEGKEYLDTAIELISEPVTVGAEYDIYATEPQFSNKLDKISDKLNKIYKDLDYLIFDERSKLYDYDKPQMSEVPQRGYDQEQDDEERLDELMFKYR